MQGSRLSFPNTRRDLTCRMELADRPACPGRGCPLVRILIWKRQDRLSRLVALQGAGLGWRPDPLLTGREGVSARLLTSLHAQVWGSDWLSSPTSSRPICPSLPCAGRGAGWGGVAASFTWAPLPPAWASFPPFCAGSWAQGTSVAMSFDTVPPVNLVMTRCPLQWKRRVLTTGSPGKSF